jgi:hypothetical protein
MGIAFVGDGDPYIRGASNVNDWHIDRCGGGFLGWNGIHLGYADGNAGYLCDLDSVDCGAFGIANYAFLDNKFMQHSMTVTGNSSVDSASTHLHDPSGISMAR